VSSISQDPLVRAAHFVGDFGSPLYGEERQRDVWNEAQAFGLQLAVWATPTAATITVWSVGGAAVPYVLGALALIGVVCLLTVVYAQRLGVDVAQPQRLLRLRLVPYGVLVLALVAGVLRAQNDGSVSFIAGVTSGALVAVVMVALMARRSRASGECGPTPVG
jgi:hypothetical protein